MHYIVPLGCDYDEERVSIGPQTITRCLRAVQSAEDLNFFREQVTLVLAPGCEPERRASDQQTMAAMMHDWFANRNFPFECITNSNDQEVWGTKAEVSWTLHQVKKHYHSLERATAPQWDDMTNATIRFISNARHLRRVKLILRWFHSEVLDGLPDAFSPDIVPVYKSPRVTYTHSNEKPPSWFHEVTSYLKLLKLKLAR